MKKLLSIFFILTLSSFSIIADNSNCTTNECERGEGGDCKTPGSVDGVNEDGSTKVDSGN